MATAESAKNMLYLKHDILRTIYIIVTHYIFFKSLRHELVPDIVYFLDKASRKKI